MPPAVLRAQIPSAAPAPGAVPAAPTTPPRPVAVFLTGLSLSATTQTLVGGVASEIQAISVHQAYGGTFTLVFKGARSAALSYDASASEVKAALEALPTVGTVLVTKSAVARTEM